MKKIAWPSNKHFYLLIFFLIFYSLYFDKVIIHIAKSNSLLLTEKLRKTKQNLHYQWEDGEIVLTYSLSGIHSFQSWNAVRVWSQAQLLLLADFVQGTRKSFSALSNSLFQCTTANFPCKYFERTKNFCRVFFTK